ncbi:MAG TPA: response regulator [Thiobacillaceae bacterium]|nr:response regulator [Thiobacillaceae bacterium]
MTTESETSDVGAATTACGGNARCSILIVDDDAELRDLLVRYLRNNGFDAIAVPDGVAMEKHLRRHPVDLVILDLMLPGTDGLTLARYLRSESDLPIIMLTARGDEVDRVVGLEVGADDYLTKPFSARELLARIRAVLRRRTADIGAVRGADGQTYIFGPYRLDVRAHRLTRGEDEVALTAADFKLLCLFVRHPNQLLSRDALMNMLKGYERAPFDRSIDVRVTRLRRKIETSPGQVFIRTVRGEGYMFTPDREAR